MHALRQSRFVRSVLLPLSLLVWLSACGPRKVELASPYAQTIESDPPGEIFVTRIDGDRLRLVSPSVRADTLLGLKYDPRTRHYTDSVTVAFSDIGLIEKKKKPSTAKLIVALSLSAALLTGVIILGIQRDNFCDEHNLRC